MEARLSVQPILRSLSSSRNWRHFSTVCCCGPLFMRTRPQWFWQCASRGFKQSSQGSRSIRFFMSLPQWLRLRPTPLSRLDADRRYCPTPFFFPCVHANLPHVAHTDSLTFSACRTIEALAPCFCPPLHDAVRMKFMLTCGLAALLVRFNF